MFNLKLLSIQQSTSPEKPPYLPKEGSTAKEKMVYLKGTASSVAHAWLPQERATSGYYSFYPSRPELRHQAGVPVGVDFGRTLRDSYYGVPHVMPEEAAVSQFYRFTARANPQKPRPLLSDESGMIVIVPLRELPRDYAKIEIAEYIQRAGDRKVYISEIVEELCLDIELVKEIVEELKRSN